MSENKTEDRLVLVDIEDPQGEAILKIPQATVPFPLTPEDRLFIDQLKEKVLQLQAAGLAAPQVGMKKQIIAYHVTADALQWRQDITELVPQQALINPSYSPIESEGKSLDWEGCFSGKSHYGKVWRYNVIRYTGQDCDGNMVEGLARGFLARLLQHEIDHCHGILCIDLYAPEAPHGDIHAMRPLRIAELEALKKEGKHFPLYKADLLANPQMKAFIDGFAQAREESKSLSLAESRVESTKLFLASQPDREPLQRIVDTVILGEGAAEIPIRIYIPEKASEALPVLMYFHGGGWVFGDIEQSDPLCRKVANRFGCIVVSVEYHLAPEHPFPIPLQDCYAATEWTAKNIASYGGNPHALSVCGESAGGNLAAAVALMAKEKGDISLTAQLLLNPVITSAINDEAYDTCSDHFFLTKESVQWFWNCYLSNAQAACDPYASPSYASSVSGLAPALIITAEHDPLRKEAEEYAAKLRRAGVKVISRCFPSVIHGFLDLPPYSEEQKNHWIEEISGLYQDLRK